MWIHYMHYLLSQVSWCFALGIFCWMGHLTRAHTCVCRHTIFLNSSLKFFSVMQLLVVSFRWSSWLCIMWRTFIHFGLSRCLVSLNVQVKWKIRYWFNLVGSCVWLYVENCVSGSKGYGLHSDDSYNMPSPNTSACRGDYVSCVCCIILILCL